jgi:CubicO group peptidase (beta-lactamase class C family)
MTALQSLTAACALALSVVVSASDAHAQTERLTAAAPRATAAGHTFTAPEGFSLDKRPNALALQPPEADATLTLVDIPQAKDADDAVAQAWAAARPEGAKRPLQIANPLPPRDGWDERRFYQYETSPNERLVVQVMTLRAGTQWLALVIEGAEPTMEKRGAPISLLMGSLRPKGFRRESFAGRTPRPIDAAMIKRLEQFLREGMLRYDVPGVAFSLIDKHKVVHEGGLGVKALGKPDPVDAHTLFIAASNTKTMTSLLMAQAVDAGLMRWDDLVSKVFPTFRLGDPALTPQVQVKHLACACTGMPRQDMQWIFEYGRHTPAGTFDLLGTLKPTSKFGEVFQYSNLMVGAGGYVAASRFAPGQELGAAYDEQMRKRIFAPLGMNSTTFDFKRALRGNVAQPHGDGFDGKSRRAAMDLNHSIVPLRPAGGVWTSAHDMSRYVLMELARGRVPRESARGRVPRESARGRVPSDPSRGRTADARRIVSEQNLLAREAPQVMVGEDVTYGLGLFVNKRLGIDIVSHGGDLLGYHSNMVWLPQWGIGFTILTNSDSGVYLRGPLQRKLLELLFDGRPEADAQLATGAANRVAQLQKARERLVMPAEAAAVRGLSARYRNAELGTIDVQPRGDTVGFDFGEWRSAVATRKNDDGTTSIITIDPGVIGIDFVVADRGGKKALVLRDAQHEYVFEAVQ